MTLQPLVVLQHEPDSPPGSIGTALRDLGVPYEVRRLYDGEPLPGWPHETCGVIVLGGAMNVTQTHAFPFLSDEIRLLRKIVHEGGPAWGVCLGAQLLTLAAGGDVYKRKKPEVGWVGVEKVIDDPLLHGVPSPFIVFSWHEYSCCVPATSHLVARTGDGVQAFRAGGKAWATQFHPEIDADIAPHWVEDAAKEHHEQGEGWLRRLHADTEKHLPGYPALCRTLTENFVLATGILTEE